MLATGGLGTLLIQAIAVRIMSARDVGTIILTLGVLSVVSTLAGVGIPEFLARLVARDRGLFAYRLSLLQFVASVASLIGIATSVIAFVAVPSLRHGWWPGLVLLAALIATRAIQYVEAAFRRGSGALLSGAVVQQGAALSAALLLAGMWLVGLAPNAGTALFLILLSQAALIVFSLLNRPLSYRKTVLSHWLTLHRPWLVLYAWTATMGMAFIWLDRLVVGGSLSVVQLTSYQNIVLLASGFDVLAVGIGYVHLPRYAALEQRSADDHQFLLALGGLGAIATALFALLFGHALFFVDWTTTNLVLLGLFIVVGILKLIYFDMSAAIGGFGQLMALRRFARFMTLSLVFGVVTTIAMASEFGVIGAAAGSIVAWVLRIASTRFANRTPLSEGTRPTYSSAKSPAPTG